MLLEIARDCDNGAGLTSHLMKNWSSDIKYIKHLQVVTVMVQLDICELRPKVVTVGEGVLVHY